MAKCACGCGQEIKEGSTYAHAHHWKAKRLATGMDSKVCEHCQRTYTRVEVGQRDEHWRRRRFCGQKCADASRRVDRTQARLCRKCDQIRQPDEFYKNQTYCKSCQRAMKKPLAPDVARARNLKAFYGITVEQYDAMLKAQGGVCAICGHPERAKNYRNGGVLPLAVDHDHRTGKVRGLLCGNCNKGIGGLDHSTERLRAAVNYLERTA